MEVSQSSLEHINSLVAAVQSELRLPGLVVAVAQGGQMVNHIAIGRADLEAGIPAGPDVQYRMGSITKTVTATAVMQLVTAGKLDLRGPLQQGWPGAPHDDISLADLLTHGSGLQREPVGSVWETLQFPNREDLAATASEARRLYPQDSWLHYSNLGFSLLGEMVAQMNQTTWEDWVAQKVLGPLGMGRTTPRPTAPAAQGYSVQPYTDEVVEEQSVDLLGIAPAGQLWSTAEDLCRWTGALAGGRPDVLPPQMLEEMRAPRTIADLEHWSWGFGLGLMLLRDGESVYVGHTGGMPGFLAAAFCHPPTQLGIVVLVNSSGGLKVGAFAAQLLSLARDGYPGAGEWAPREGPPARIVPLLGRWWSEWNEWVFRWRDGRLQAKLADAPSGDPATEFAEIGSDQFVALNGSERGERLIVVRGLEAESTTVKKLYWATYPFTREPERFGEPD